MRLLTKIKLINWHFFDNETIPIEGSTLITGDNGAGKSTLIDALQLAIVANVKKVRFNSSAMEDRTTRDLKSYLRGKTGTEGGTSFRRNEDFSSYIVLEITHTQTGKQYLIGVVFDYYHVTGEEEHVFFKVDEAALNDDLFFHEPHKPRNRRQFFDYLKARGIKHRQYRNDISTYTYDLRQLFGAKESFFSLFTKGISFSPITDLRRFVYDYILEERAVDVKTMREYFERFRQVELMIEETKKEIAALESIEEQYGEIERLRLNLDMNDYMVLRARWETSLARLRQKEEQKRAEEEKMTALAARISAAEAEKRALEQALSALERSISENQAGIREKELRRRIEELRNRQAELARLEDNLIHQMNAEVNEIRALADILCRVEAPVTLSQGLMDAQARWAEAVETDTACFPEDHAELARSWQKAREWLTVRSHSWAEEERALCQDIERLHNTIQELGRNQVLGSDSPTMKLKRVLEEHLFTPAGEKVPVYLFCEAIDIRDGRWRNAIEGYLHTQKFDLLVPPEYFDDALTLYERHKFTCGIERVGLVNTGRLMAEVRPRKPGSLAEEITACVDYAAAYADWLLGGVIKCDSEKELKQHARAITDSCMLYQNHTARQIPRSRYDMPFIGKEAVQFQMARRKEELREREARLRSCREMLALADGARRYAADKADRYERWRQDTATLKEKARVAEALEQSQREIMTLDLSELRRLERERDEKRRAQNGIEESLRQLAEEQGDARRGIREMDQQLAALRLEAEGMRSEYESFVANLADELRERCHRKWENESSRRDPETLLANYRGSREGLKTRLDKQMQSLVRVRTDFVHQFNFSGDPEAPDNEAFRRRHRLLVDSHLQDYEAKAKEAREQAERSFQEHFVAKIGEYIQDAHLEIKELNRALKDMRFGTDSYTFSLSAKSETRRFYDMITDTEVYHGSIFRDAFLQKHGEAIQELFAEITRSENEFSETMQVLTDYRSFLDFEIVITDDRGYKSHFSKVARDKSGGETQVPFYVAILASFYRAYQLYRNKDSLRLVVFDEAFNRMDADRIEEAICFMKNLEFQAIIVAPTGRIQLIVPHVNTSLIVMKEGFHSYVERVSRKDLGQWN
ncbi:MAG: SbcC/MukB-like Walker B domain-containing protein [Bacillota bacterium]